ncbi:MAG TPA: hypothetical protein VIC08_04730 [Cellvibrionaceae bacterium]
MKNTFVIMFALLLTACDSGGTSAPEEKPAPILEGHVKALESAKQVEQDLKDAEQKRRQQLE